MTQLIVLVHITIIIRQEEVPYSLLESAPLVPQLMVTSLTLVPVHILHCQEAYHAVMEVHIRHGHSSQVGANQCGTWAIRFNTPLSPMLVLSPVLVVPWVEQSNQTLRRLARPITSKHGAFLFAKCGYSVCALALRSNEVVFEK